MTFARHAARSAVRRRDAGRSTSRTDRTVHPKPTPTIGRPGDVRWASSPGSAPRAVPARSSRPERGELRSRSARWSRARSIARARVVDDTRGDRARRSSPARSSPPASWCWSASQLAVLLLPGQGVVVLLGRTSRCRSRSLWVVAIVNAVNLVDGLDGLAAGHGGDRRDFLLRLCRPESGRARRRVAAALISAIAAGICSGSCRGTSTPRRSSWATPARCCSGCCSPSRRSRASGKNLTSRAAATSPRSPGRSRVPLLVLAIPRSTWRWRSFAARAGVRDRAADKEHIHHRLMEIGHSHRQAVLLMYLWSALVAGGRAGGRLDRRPVRRRG